MGAQMNRLIETVLLSTHNICFELEIRNFIFDYVLLSVGLHTYLFGLPPILFLPDMNRFHRKPNFGD